MDVPPSGGSLEIGNRSARIICSFVYLGSPFGGIPRNWKQLCLQSYEEMFPVNSSPFGGIPRNWKQCVAVHIPPAILVSSPFGGIPRNWKPGNEFPCVVDLLCKFPLRGDP